MGRPLMKIGISKTPRGWYLETHRTCHGCIRARVQERFLCNPAASLSLSTSIVWTSGILRHRTEVVVGSTRRTDTQRSPLCITLAHVTFTTIGGLTIAEHSGSVFCSVGTCSEHARCCHGRSHRLRVKAVAHPGLCLYTFWQAWYFPRDFLHRNICFIQFNPSYALQTSPQLASLPKCTSQDYLYGRIDCIFAFLSHLDTHLSSFQ